MDIEKSGANLLYYVLHGDWLHHLQHCASMKECCAFYWALHFTRFQ